MNDWTDHLKAVGLMLLGVGAITLFVWLCVWTNGLVAFAAVVGFILVCVYLVVLDHVREYQRQKAHKEFMSGLR